MIDDIPILVHFNLVSTDNIKGCLPQQSENLSTGFDVRNAGPNLTIRPFQRVKIPLGFRAFIPSGWWFKLVPRSSTFTKKQLHCLYGTIDESYEGQWLFAAQYIPSIEFSPDDIQIRDTPDGTRNNYFSFLKEVCEKNILHIEHGEKVAQIIMQPRYRFTPAATTDDEFSNLVKHRDADRGAGGFGSTGDK